MNFFQSHQKHWRSVTNRFIPRYNYLIFYLTNGMLKSTTSLSTCLAMFLVIFLLLYSIAAAVAFPNDLLRFALVTVVLRSEALQRCWGFTRPGVPRTFPALLFDADVAGLGRSTIFQSVRDEPSIFLVGLRDKCIHRSSQVTGHSQIALILHEIGAILH